MFIYNTLTGKKEEFKSLLPNKIGMYVCGPTVYDKGHLGHARSMLSFDMIRRYFEFKGYEVNFVTNFTDIDDKMINRANEQGITVQELADKIIPMYERDFDALKIKRPTSRPLATDQQNIDTMFAMIHKLLKEDSAYEIDGDGIYFDVSKFDEYGKLSKQNLDELQHGSRIAVKDQKRTPHDFVLWKYKKDSNEPSWIDPMGLIKEGRPGWHIECSAMTLNLLGETFDIHAGGLDLTFPHHECEIAQSELCNGVKFANYWMHNGFVNIDGEKMSKSLNNFQTIEDALKTYNPLALRYLLLSTHYRSPINFTDEMLEQAVSARNRIQEFYERVSKLKVENEELRIDNFSKYRTELEEALDDDFNVSAALATIFEFIKFINRELDLGKMPAELVKGEILDFLNVFNEIFQVIETEVAEFGDDIQQLIEQRAKARENRDFKLSDELRDKLFALGVESKDSPAGSVYRRL